MYIFYLTDVICFSVLISFELWSRVSLFNLVFKILSVDLLWLHWVFVALRRISLVVVSRGSLHAGAGVYHRLLLSGSMGSGHVGFSSCRAQAQ